MIMESTKDLENDKELVTEEELDDEEQLEPEHELVGEKEYGKDDILTSSNGHVSHLYSFSLVKFCHNGFS